jgi:hypothetical protein
MALVRWQQPWTGKYGRCAQDGEWSLHLRHLMPSRVRQLAMTESYEVKMKGGPEPPATPPISP